LLSEWGPKCSGADVIPVIDIFAGPGGLGEGFSSWRGPRGAERFRLSISIEKDLNAHATLRLRAFRRCFGKVPPRAYDRHLRGEIPWQTLAAEYPIAARKADTEAQCIELGRASVEEVRHRIKAALPSDGPWVLVGGPPCQAYSLVGRARNKGNANYTAELDERQKLYVEYLQVLADHAPPVFVMENVKGLLSAKLNRQGLFARIREDLRNPAIALRRENRHTSSRRPRYEIRAVMSPSDAPCDEATGYVVRAEEFGVPQRRHRVILIGVRSDLSPPSLPAPATETTTHSVAEALDGLPRLRSGLSKTTDSDRAWLDTIRSFRSRRWMGSGRLDHDVRLRIQRTLDGLSIPAASRGADHLRARSGDVVLNHSARGHMVPDLERYLFASAFAAVRDISPVLRDFPELLRPKHQNVDAALGNGMFADRFRVQVANAPATTVTSHISKDGHYYIHHDPSQCRSLTVREAARLQTFPDDYFFCGPRTSQYQQVGNAVPPLLGRVLAGAVAGLLGD
jgi:DNA (cytosine-5)-methyltransferase 1